MNTAKAKSSGGKPTQLGIGPRSNKGSSTYKVRGMRDAPVGQKGDKTPAPAKGKLGALAAKGKLGKRGAKKAA